MESSPVDDKEVEELRKQLQELKELVLSLTNEKPIKSTRRKKAPSEKVYEKELLAPNTYIKVMSLVHNPLNLSTRSHGKGKTFRFEKFGTVKPMFYSELLEVIENHPNFFNAGYFYILDSRVIEENNWHEIYARILTKEQMELIFENSSNAITLFSGANEKQQKLIADYFIDRMVNHLPVDRNLVAELSRISGIDINKKVESISMPEQK